MNNKIDRAVVLKTLIKHETLTIDDLAKEEVIGFAAEAGHLKFLLEELCDSEHLVRLKGVAPLTYSITTKGIDEGIRLNKLTIPGVHHQVR